MLGLQYKRLNAEIELYEISLHPYTFIAKNSGRNREGKLMIGMFDTL